MPSDDITMLDTFYLTKKFNLIGSFNTVLYY